MAQKQCDLVLNADEQVAFCEKKVLAWGTLDDPTTSSRPRKRPTEVMCKNWQFVSFPHPP